MPPESLARAMLELNAKGCANVEPVSPTHHLPGFLEALSTAVEQGLNVPVVYNTNGYETLDALELLDGIVDVYLPDLKYASDDAALRYSHVGDYVQTARAAILEMYSQVGNLVVDLQGRAMRGLIIRHLVLPEGISGSRETLFWIRDNFPTTVTVSLMAQYSPLNRAAEFPPLDRRLLAEEYEAAMDLSWDIGLENVFVQDLSSQETGIPDFERAGPFEWDGEQTQRQELDKADITTEKLPA